MTISDDDDRHGARSNLKLVVYGDSPRSTRAVDNIRDALNQRGTDPQELEIVDVVAEPERALELRTFAVPQLMLDGPLSNHFLCGDLSDRERLDRWLDEMSDSDNNDPSTSS